MIKNFKPIFLQATILSIVFLAFVFPAQAAALIQNLKVEYSKTPLGLDVKNPRFNWQMVTKVNERGYMQTAYKIVVKDPEGTIMWDTQKVPGSASIGIAYSGDPLKATTRYTWTVTVWDQKGKPASDASWFETGLMDTDPGSSAWEGAKWIGGGPNDLVLQAHFLSVFKVNYTIKLDSESKSTKASFILGANDGRLLDKNKNIFNIESKHNESYIKLELDISSVGVSEAGNAKFNIYRAGYHPDDNKDVIFFSASIPRDIINNENKYERHFFFIESVFGALTVFVDEKDNHHRLSPSQGGQMFGGGSGLNLNPVGKGGDYIAFPLLADIGFSVDSGQKASFSEVAVTHYREPSNKMFGEDLFAADYKGIYKNYVNDGKSGFSVSNGAYTLDGGSSGSLITADPSQNSMPMLRSEFAPSGKEIKAARLYITARGIYEMYLNGKRVGEDYFNPGLTQYNITHMYQTYDVTSMIIPGGKNAIGAWLGEGWWSGAISFTGSNWNFFGDRQSLMAKLVITYGDGSETVITTNDRDWKFYNNGPILYGSLFQGEMYDATREASVKGWNTAGYDDSKWTKAVEIPLSGTTFTGTSADFTGSKSNFNFDKMSLIGQIGENAGIVKELTAVKVEEVRPGVFVYDMGQNMVGVPRVTIPNAEPGKKITFRYAEVLYPDLPESGKNVGMIMIENLRAALVQDIYITKGGNDIFQPRFTFHGYRYLEITGIDKPLPLESVRGMVISSVHELTSDYETSDPKVNRLWQNIVWSTLGNFLSIPTDCPQRNERMGWSGDISVFSRTSTYVTNADKFLTRHMIAMRNLQMPSGKFTDTAPVVGAFGGLLWGSAGMTIPWEAYLQYGDTDLLEEHYNAMTAYMDFLATTINKNTGLSSESQLGDWLGPQTNQVGTQLIVTAYHIFDLEIMVRTAEILNKSADAEKYRKMYNERKEFFNRTFVNSEKKTLQGPNGKLSDTQTSYAVGLALGAFNDENIPFMVKNLAETVKRENKDDGGVMRPVYSLMTGFIGTAWISKALSDNGFSELAYRILQNNKYPSWLYAIDQGATTIWERLNGYTIENGFGGNNSMNSFNHYSFGAVGQWMMAYSLGIQRDEPGFRKFNLQPEPDPTGMMTRAKGYYDSMYGRISSGWNVENGILTYTAIVPPNTIATLYIPAASAGAVKENDKAVKKSKGVTFIKYESGKAVFELKSGSYKFTSSL
ncbi:MAG: family 78 glycoside hydrolase catalytic domain [Bacteroidia bacterium]|nr:family 78 glycoside hydrolase catalytic domain [Bacteroidia bacterium]